MRQLYYNRAEIYLSDHLPVSAVFEAKVKTVDKAKLSELRSKFQEEFDKDRREQFAYEIQEKIKQGVVELARKTLR